MTELQLSTGTYLLVDKIPEDAENIEHHRPDYGKENEYITYHTGMGTEDYDILRETLPEGEYELIGKGNELGEEQWSGIVEEKNFKFPLVSMTLYMNYNTNEFEYGFAKNSGYSLIESKNLKPETTIILKKI